VCQPRAHGHCCSMLSCWHTRRVLKDMLTTSCQLVGARMAVQQQLHTVLLSLQA
jgi:hypothetical protein